MKTTLIGPLKEVITMEGLPKGGPIHDQQLLIIKDGGILIAGSTIREVAPYNALKKQQVDEVITCDVPTVALPGFVDSHTHICWAGERSADYAKRVGGMGKQKITANGGGILDTVRQTRAASLAELAALTTARADHLFMQGVTTCEVKSGYGLSRSNELKQLRAIKTAAHSHPITFVTTCLAAHVRPPESGDNSEYLNAIVGELLPAVIDEELASRVDICIDEGAFSVDEGRDYLLRAQELGFAVTIHADQFTTGGSLLAVEMGAASADHLELSGEAEIEALGVGGVIPVILPGTSLGLGSPFAPARQILDAGLPLAIASDWNPGSAPMGMLLTQAAILGAYEKLTLAETLAAITYRAAAALEMHDRGTLASGCRADIAFFPCNSYAEVFYRQGTLLPSAVMAAGHYYRSDHLRPL